MNTIPDKKNIKSTAGRPPLRVVSFWDGRPGHEKQTRGILAALGDLTAIEETPQKVRPLSKPGRVLQTLAYLAGAGARPAPKAAETGADLIIGTGSATHVPMLLFKKACLQARAVTCMTPDFPFRAQMDLCFVPRHDRPRPQRNIFETVGPPGNVRFAGEHDPRRGLILMGGLDPKSHYWDSDMLLARIKTVLQREPDCRWVISSSPRTPPETIAKLADFAAAAGVQFFRSQETPAGWIEEQYRVSATVWVSADSVSMVYEALAAGCRVGVLPVRWRRQDNKFQKSLDFLETNHYVSVYEKWLADGYAAPPSVRLDEAGRCARELLRRWWPERLR